MSFLRVLCSSPTLERASFARTKPVKPFSENLHAISQLSESLNLKKLKESRIFSLQTINTQWDSLSESKIQIRLYSAK